MAVATEKIIPGVLPPREETEGVDFTGIRAITGTVLRLILCRWNRLRED